jgi:hypothetical protein
MFRNKHQHFTSVQMNDGSTIELLDGIEPTNVLAVNTHLVSALVLKFGFADFAF